MTGCNIYNCSCDEYPQGCEGRHSGCDSNNDFWFATGTGIHNVGSQFSNEASGGVWGLGSIFKYNNSSLIEEKTITPLTIKQKTVDECTTDELLFAIRQKEQK